MSAILDNDTQGRGIARNLLRRDKRGGLLEVQGQSPVGGLGMKPPEAPRMLNIRLNIATDRQKSRTVQSPIIL